MAKALHAGTAKLPEIEIESTEILLATKTEKAIRSGILYSAVGLVDAVISRLKLPPNFKVVATGGFAPMVAEHTSTIDVVDENLLHDGLRLIYERK